VNRCSDLRCRGSGLDAAAARRGWNESRTGLAVPIERPARWPASLCLAGPEIAVDDLDVTASVDAAMEAVTSVVVDHEQVEQRHHVAVAKVASTIPGWPCSDSLGGESLNASLLLGGVSCRGPVEFLSSRLVPRTRAHPAGTSTTRPRTAPDSLCSWTIGVSARGRRSLTSRCSVPVSTRLTI
jgi:hypothetical protein